MSSNIRLVKVCEYCKREWIAQKTTSKTCSNDCAKRFYKLKQKEKKIQQAVLQEEIKRKPKAFVTEEEIRALQAKENLTLKEASLLLNVSPLTLRRWVFAGKVKSEKVGKKHVFKRTEICISEIAGNTQK